MGGMKIIGRIRARLKKRSQPPLDLQQTEWGFAVDKIRKLVVSYQDGGTPGLWFPEDGNLAAELGHAELMKASNGVFRYSLDAMNRAAKNGFLDVLAFLLQEGSDCTTEAMDGAAKEGHLDVVIWLHRNTTAGATKVAMDSAAANGCLSVLKWLHSNRNEGCTVSAMNWAAAGGHLDVVKWLHRNRKEGCTTAAFDRAAMNNHVEVVMWLLSNRDEGGTDKALQWAVGRGHTQMVGLLLLTPEDDKQGLKKKGSSLSTASAASLSGVGLALESPGLATRASSASAGFGQRQVTSFRCSKYAMDKAAQGGHLGVLKMLHDRGHSCTTNAMDWAAAFGQTDIVAWLSENRTEGCTRDAMDHAAASGHLDTVKWLHYNRLEGCTRYAITDAAGNGHMETVKWLHKHRKEGCGRRAMDDAAANGHLEMVRWLCNNRIEGCSREAMERAARNGHLEVVKMLHQAGAPCSAAAIHLAQVHGHRNIYHLLNALYPGKTSSLDHSKDEMLLAEQEMVEDDKKRELELEREERRRRRSVFSTDYSAARRERNASLPILFGKDGKPALPRINTFKL